MMSNGPTTSNGGKWELMHYVFLVSSHLPPLGGVGASDMIDIALVFVSLLILFFFNCFNLIIPYY